ncbi:MAG TPA: sodium:proton antiporter, partial [Actinomycetota bacterium]|nr:sodium:proton antiporter [Actinomycetota bacterium]
VPLMAEVPLMVALREGGDTGTPIVASDPDSPAGVAFRQAARGLAQAVRSKVGRPLTLLAGPGAPAGHGHAH